MSKHSYESVDLDVCSHESPSVMGGELASAVPDGDGVHAMASIFDALADPTRLRIVSSLLGGEYCVCDLAGVCQISQSGVSHQLRVLRERRLVAFRREGKRALYRLADDHVSTLFAVALEHAQEDSGEQ